MNYLLFNPLSNSNSKDVKAKELLAKLGDGKLFDVTKTDVKQFFAGLEAEDKVYLVGGDGTLNHFANDMDGVDIKQDVYYYPGGSGNDFFNDVKDSADENGLIKLNDLLKDLPTVFVNGIERKFVNGIGFGLDGMCCQIADDQRAKGVEKINYTAIAIKLLLFTYKRRPAKVVVDGVEKTYKNVWILPTMKGKFYGGGMMIAPSQDRRNEKGEVSVVVFWCNSRLKMLMNFSKVFTGEHVNLKNMIEIRTGKEIRVEYEEPTALQIDGETVRNVLTYTVKA